MTSRDLFYDGPFGGASIHILDFLYLSSGIQKRGLILGLVSSDCPSPPFKSSGSSVKASPGEPAAGHHGGGGVGAS